MMRLAMLVSVALAVLSAGCGGGAPTTAPSSGTSGSAVTELKDIAQLQSAFNAHDGVPRLIVLASPT